jgi:hypothetical protein
MSLKFIKPEKILLASHPEYREKWVQERIAEDPSILGLGEIVLKDRVEGQRTESASRRSSRSAVPRCRVE